MTDRAGARPTRRGKPVAGTRRLRRERARLLLRSRRRRRHALLRSVLDAPITVLYGRSGLGKTSLLQAALFPAPARERTSCRSTSAWTSRPTRRRSPTSFGRCVREAVQAEVPDARLPGRRTSRSGSTCTARDLELWSARNFLLTPVLVIDQFEELFTARAAGARPRAELPERLSATWSRTASPPTSPVSPRRRRGRAVGRPRAAIAQLQAARSASGRTSCPISRAGSSSSRCSAAPAAPAADGPRTPRCEAVHEPGLRTSCTRAQARAGWSGSSPGRTCAVAGDGLDDRAPSVERPTGLDVEPALLSLFCRELNEARKRRGAGTGSTSS